LKHLHLLQYAMITSAKMLKNWHENKHLIYISQTKKKKETNQNKTILHARSSMDF